LEIRNRLKWGVLDLVPIFEGADAGFALAQAVELARTAERIGCSRYWIAEHHDMEGLACTSPEVLLAHIGARTERIRIGSGALLLPHYKPFKVAENFHMLAALYPGRIDLGLGRAPGGSAHVSMALSGNFLENVRHVPDSLQALTDLFAGRYEYEGQRVTARPIPPIPPELWMLGTNRKSAAYAAEYGTGYVFGQFMSEQDGMEMLGAYREAFRPSPHLSQPRAIVAVGVVCAETEAEARALASEGSALFGEGGQSESDRQTTARSRRLFIGDPGQVKAQLEELQSLYGVDEFLIVTLVPDYAKRLRSYELLAQAFGL
jgi:luciferase family oxidoreductase group 1